MGSSKELYVSYYYLDQAGNIIEPVSTGDMSSTAKIVDKTKDPTKQDIKPETVSVANCFVSFPANLADCSGDKWHNLVNNDMGAWIAGTPYDSDKYDDVFEVNAVAYLPEDVLEQAADDYPHYIAIPPSVKSDYNKSVSSGENSLCVYLSQYAKAYADSEETSRGAVKDIAVAKLPIIWLKVNEGSQETYIKVWDMLDPWDYQVFLTMLAKEVNSNSTYDTMLELRRFGKL